MSKRKIEHISESDDNSLETSTSGDEDAEEEDEVSGESFQVEFDLFGQNEKDFHSLKVLCKDMLGVPFDTSELADMLINSPVGSVIKADGEESEAFGITSVVDITPSRVKNNFVKVIQNYVLNIAKQTHNKEIDQICKLLGVEPNNDGTETQIGLFVNERFCNLPIEVALPMNKCVFSELNELNKDDKAVMKMNSFDYFLYITRYLEPSFSSKKKKTNPGKLSRLHVDPQLKEYKLMEDEVYMKEAQIVLSAQRCGTNETSSDVINDHYTSSLRLLLDGRVMREHSLVCFVKRDRITNVLSQIEELQKHYK